MQQVNLREGKRKKVMKYRQKIASQAVTWTDNPGNR